MTYQPELLSTRRYLVIFGVCLAMASCNLEPATAKDKTIPYVSSIVQMDFITPNGVRGSGTKSYHNFDCVYVMKEINTWIRFAIKQNIFKKARAKCYPLRGA